MKAAHTCKFAIVLALPGVVACDPIGQVFQRFRDGAAESVARLYERATAPAKGPDATKPSSPGS